MAENKYGKTFITKNPVRCTFLQVHEPKGPKDKFNKNQFVATLLIDPKDKEVMVQLREEIVDIAEVEKLSEICKHPFIDDEGKTKNGSDKDPAKYPGHAERIPIQVTSDAQFPPTLAYVEDGTMYSFDEATLGEASYKKMVKKLMYSGAWYHVSLQAHTYEDQKKNDLAVTFYLKGLLKVKDDEELSSGESTMDLFKNAIPGLKTGTALFGSAVEEEDSEGDEEDAKPTAGKKRASKSGMSAMDALDAADEDDDMPRANGKVAKEETAPAKAGRGRPKGKPSADLDALFNDD